MVAGVSTAIGSESSTRVRWCRRRTCSGSSTRWRLGRRPLLRRVFTSASVMPHLSSRCSARTGSGSACLSLASSMGPLFRQWHGTGSGVVGVGLVSMADHGPGVKGGRWLGVGFGSRAGCEAPAASSVVLEWRGLFGPGAASAVCGLTAARRAEPLCGADGGVVEETFDGGGDEASAGLAREAASFGFVGSVTHSRRCRCRAFGGGGRTRRRGRVRGLLTGAGRSRIGRGAGRP